MNKSTICLWYNNDAEEAAAYYAATFPDTRIPGLAGPCGLRQTIPPPLKARCWWWR